MTEIVLINSDLAARYVTGISGWVSRNGLFFGDGREAESLARYEGCTHVPCNQCGQPAKKGWLLCDACRDRKDLERYEAMPRTEWDGVAMLYSQVTEDFYRDIDEAEDSLEEGQSLADLRLVICEPNYARKLDEEDFFDHLDDDGETPKQLLDAINQFNQAVDGLILSWSPGKQALLVDDVFSFIPSTAQSDDLLFAFVKK